ncbi:MAG: ABC transporter ATP-binding protein [Candidatus Cloacimonetes bacterium]|nr:ABC transporter ATP-binding protein [Candidatus Cloacimonadota bacterium]
MLKTENLSFRYNPEQPWLIKKFSFEAENGDIIAVKGSSGSGKTTLLNILCGVIPKTIPGEFEGKISMNKKDISSLLLPEIAPHISLLMQEPENQLFFPTVEQELAFAPENLKITPEKIQERISLALSQLDIEQLRFEETASLSFGQKKLVTLASILTLSPKVYLLDEPAAGISKENIELVKNLIFNLSQHSKIIFVVDHTKDLLEMANLSIDLDKLK